MVPLILGNPHVYGSTKSALRARMCVYVTGPTESTRIPDIRNPAVFGAPCLRTCPYQATTRPFFVFRSGGGAVLLLVMARPHDRTCSRLSL